MRPAQRDWFGLTTFLAAAAILIWQLFVPRVVGLANNGDFHKVLSEFLLAAPVEDEYIYAPTTYTFDRKNYLPFEFHSTEQLLTAAAVGLNRVLGHRDTFDLRAIGVIHGALYLLALWLALPLLRTLSPARRVIASLAILLVFFDVAYVAGLNSFYMDTAALIFLLLCVVLLCRILVWQRPTDAWAFLACALCMIAAKAQHAPLGLVIAGLIAVRPSRILPGLNRWIRLTALALLLAATVLTLRSTPWDYRTNPTFSTVFYAILPRSHDASQDLRELGLDDSYRKYIGMYYSQPGAPDHDPEFARSFLPRATYARIGWYLLRHPRIAYELTLHGLHEAGRQRPLMGNFDRSTGVAPSTESRQFACWSDAKRRLFDHHGARYFWSTVALAAAWLLTLLIRRSQLPAGAFEAGCALLAALTMELLIALFGDALDFIRHSFLFMTLWDLMLVALVINVTGLFAPANSPTR